MFQTDRSKLNANFLTPENETCDRNIDAFEAKYKTEYSELNCGMNYINIAYDNCSVAELVKIPNGKTTYITKTHSQHVIVLQQ